jgi:hypothetical protein
MRIACVLVPIVAVLAMSSARADTTTFSVEIGGESWQAEALAAALRSDLADNQLQPAAKPALIIRGELANGQLRYAILRAGAAPIRGAIALRGLDRMQLAGVLRDDLHRIVSEHVVPAPPAELAEPDAGGAIAVLAGLAAVLVLPLAIGGGLLRRRALRLRGTRQIAVALAAITVLAYIVIAQRDRIPELSGVVILVGGLAWGALAAATFPVAIPSLFGLHRVEHGELVPVLAAWLALAAQRLFACALVAVPTGVGLWLVGDALALPLVIAFGVIAPVLGLAIRLGSRAITEAVSLRLDGELVDGDASELQPWHPQVRAYFVGYLGRANLTVDEQLLDHVMFLPGREPEVAVYGGGLTHTRVVIPRAMLEHALAPYGRPHDYAMPRVSTLHWMHWNAGVVMPTGGDTKLATREDRKPHATPDEGEQERIALGEPPTLSGIIEPRAFDPRTSYRPGEDPLWLDWDPGEEFDGTDAGDKDFLFGVLVHAMGMKQRHEDRGAAIGLALRRSKRKPAQLIMRATGPLRRFAARRTLGDVYAALGGARHHLAQYLAWLAWQREDLSTARAHAPQLEQTSRKIVAALDGNAAPDPGLRRRLDHLRLFIAPSRGPRRVSRRLALAFTLVVGLVAVGAVVQGVLYHPTYEARVEQERLDHGKAN